MQKGMQVMVDCKMKRMCLRAVVCYARTMHAGCQKTEKLDKFGTRIEVEGVAQGVMVPLKRLANCGFRLTT